MQYFFDLTEGVQTTHDTDGKECRSFEAMRQQAMALLGEIASHTTYTADNFLLSVRVRDSEREVYGATLTIARMEPTYIRG